MSKTNLTRGDNGVKKSAFHNFKYTFDINDNSKWYWKK